MNKNNLRQNGEKGITLIALVITIIVMLILVAVTISMAVNGGLFEYAGKATGETKNAINAEQELANGGIEVDGVWYSSIDEYLIASGNKGKGITATTMQSDLASYLGQKIAYGGTYTDASTYGNGEWEIFYSDGEHIYIITRGHLAKGYLSTSGYNGTTDFTAESISTKYPAVGEGLLNKTYDPTAAGTAEDPYLKYTSINMNMTATQYLLDSTVWASYANNEYAEWAIGGPTFELFVNSYNAYYPDNAVTLETPSGTGYANPLSASNSVPSGTYLNPSTSGYYWLACPSIDNGSSVRELQATHSRIDDCLTGIGIPFRPVVCLDSDVQLTWDSTNSEYTLSRAS